MLVTVQVCSRVQVLRDWGVLSVNSDLTFSDVFHGVHIGQLDSTDAFCLEEQYGDFPVSCSIVLRPIKRVNFNSFSTASMKKTPWNSAST